MPQPRISLQQARQTGRTEGAGAVRALLTVLKEDRRAGRQETNHQTDRPTDMHTDTHVLTCTYVHRRHGKAWHCMYVSFCAHTGRHADMYTWAHVRTYTYRAGRDLHTVPGNSEQKRATRHNGANQHFRSLPTTCCISVCSRRVCTSSMWRTQKSASRFRTSVAMVSGVRDISLAESRRGTREGASSVSCGVSFLLPYRL